MNSGTVGAKYEEVAWPLYTACYIFSGPHARALPLKQRGPFQ